MESMEILKRKIKGAQSLHSITRTMKILAAVSLRQYEKTLRAINGYNDIIEKGFTVAMRSLDDGDIFTQKMSGLDISKSAIAVFGTDLGMCGRFNDQIAEFVSTKVKAGNFSKPEIMIIGEKLANKMDDAGLKAGSVLDFPSGISSGLTPLLNSITIILQDWYLKNGINRILLAYNSPEIGGFSYAPKIVEILPLGTGFMDGLRKQEWKSNSLPVIKEDFSALFDKLILQYIYINLRAAIAASITSENAARLSAMQAAEKNIEEHLDNLNLEYNQERQNMITSEILDIIAGFETVTA